MTGQQMGGGAGRQFLPPEDGASEPELTRGKARQRSAEMDRRSWYMPAASADALSELVDNLHWETRLPKATILRAVVDEVLARQSHIERRLKRA